jgi:hypothetical protein
MGLPSSGPLAIVAASHWAILRPASPFLDVMKLKPSDLWIPAVIGALFGAAAAEFSPRLFSRTIPFLERGLVLMTDPFSSHRNELAVKWALIGAGIGLAVGLLGMLLAKRK